MRHYVDSGDCFFELKHRGPRDCIVKRRLTLDPALGDSLTPESVAALERWAQAAHGRSAPGPLEPVLEVDFTRATLVAPDRGERLTIVRQDLLPAHETLFPVPEYVGNWA